MVNADRNPLWPAAALLASIWAGIVTAVLMAAFLAGPIQDFESLTTQRYDWETYWLDTSGQFDAQAMEKRIRAHARSLGIPDANLICVLIECRQSQTVQPTLYVRTSPSQGQRLWEFTGQAMRLEADRLKKDFPSTKQISSIGSHSNDCSER